MTENSYKEEQAKRKQTQAMIYKPKANSESGMAVIDGVIHKFTKQGVKKLGIVVSGREYLMPPDPLNKKERAKMKRGLPYLNKKRKLITPED